MTDPATSPQGGEDVRVPDAEGVADAYSSAGDFDDNSRDEAPDDDRENLDEEEDELVELEYEGRRYQAPRPLKDAFLRHADYTRKTQELAEQRRAIEAHAAEIAEVDQQRLAGVARLMAVDDQITAYGQLDWDSLEAQDPVRAARMWREYSQLKDGRAALTQQLQWTEEHLALEAQRAIATRVEEGHQELARDIKGWSPELAMKLSDFGQRAFGFSDDELSSVADPRMIKVLHLAYVGDQTLKRQAAASRLSASQAARPVSQVGANTPAGRNPDRMTTDEWMAYERERLRRKGGR